MNSLDQYDLSKTTPVAAIREFCRVCNGEEKGGNKFDCLDVNCILYPWKLAKGIYEHPDTVTQEHKDYIKSLGNSVYRSSISDATRLARSERMKLMWQNKKNNKI